MTRYQKQILELRLNGFSPQEIAEKWKKYIKYSYAIIQNEKKGNNGLKRKINNKN